MSFEIAKAGWLMRESSVLHRWKNNWFVLYQDGTLRFFETPESHVSEEAIRIQTECLSIRVGQQVTDVTPPAGHNRNCLLTIVLNNNKTWNICAQSTDDLSAWHISLEDARLVHASRPHASRSAPPAPPPPYAATAYTQHTVTGYPHQTATGYPHQTATGYPQQIATGYPQQAVAYGYPGQVVYGSQPPNYVVQAPPGQTTIIYDDRQRYYRRGYNDGDAAMGFMAGAALGSMLYSPYMFY